MIHTEQSRSMKMSLRPSEAFLPAAALAGVKTKEGQEKVA
jgi:hypothetical protein